MASAFLMGVVIGIVIAAIIAGWKWLALTQGSDHPLTREEIRDRVGETW